MKKENEENNFKGRFNCSIRPPSCRRNTLNKKPIDYSFLNIGESKNKPSSNLVELLNRKIKTE